MRRACLCSGGQISGVPWGGKASSSREGTKSRRNLFCCSLYIFYFGVSFFFFFPLPFLEVSCNKKIPIQEWSAVLLLVCAAAGFARDGHIDSYGLRTRTGGHLNFVSHTGLGQICDSPLGPPSCHGSRVDLHFHRIFSTAKCSQSLRRLDPQLSNKNHK